MEFDFEVGHGAPLLVVGSVFRELVGGPSSMEDEPSHLESDPVRDDSIIGGMGIDMRNIQYSSSGRYSR